MKTLFLAITFALALFGYAGTVDGSRQDAANLTLTGSTTVRDGLTSSGTNTLGNVVVTNAGSVSVPSLSITQSVGGLYSTGTNNLSLASGGSLSIDMNVSSIYPKKPLKSASGSITAPAYGFDSDYASGWYRAGSADIRMAVSGTDRLTVTSSGLVVNGTASASSIDVVVSGTTYLQSGTGGTIVTGTMTAGYIALSTGTTAAPGDAVNVKGYVDLVTSSGTFKLPLYQ